MNFNALFFYSDLLIDRMKPVDDRTAFTRTPLTEATQTGRAYTWVGVSTLDIFGLFPSLGRLF